jgi:hypothetical protein
MLQFGDIKIVSGGWNDIVVVKEVARLVVGVPLWLVFWAWAGRLFDGPNEEEQESALRKFYLYSVIFIAAITAVTNATFILAGAFRRLLDLPSSGDIRNPLPIVIGMALLWAYHAYVLRLDSARVTEARRQAGIRRLYLYLIAAIGLAVFLVGLSGDISVLIRSLSQTSFSNVLKEQLAWFTAALIAGFPVWLLPWRRAQSAAVAQSPEGAEERRSLVRRIYLYFYLFVATMAVLSSAVYIVYQLLSLLLGDRSPRYLMRDIGQAIAFTLIGVGVWLYHGSVLRSDGQINRRERADRLGEWKTTVVDIGEGSFGNAVIEGISRVLPGITPKLIRLPLIIREDDEPSTSATQQLTEANVIVGPWTIAVAGGSGGMVNAEVANIILNSPARKLLVPIPAEGWDWAGVDNRNTEALVQQTVHAFRQIAEGVEVKAAKPLGFGASVGIFLGIFLLLVLIAIPLIYFFSY